MPSYGQSLVSSLTGINGPTFVAIDTDAGGTKWLYVSEHGVAPANPQPGDPAPSGGGRVLKYNLTSGSTTPIVVATRYDATANPNGFISPDGIVVDPSTHNIFVADRYLNRVQLINPSITTGNNVVMRWGSSTAGAADEMHGPAGLARDSAGAIYVGMHGDTNGAGVFPHEVVKFTLNGTNTPTRTWHMSNGLSTPYGLAVNGANLYVADGFNAQVQVWNTSDGTPSGSVASIPMAAANIIPTGLSIDSGNSLWVTESSDGGTGAIEQVQKASLTGQYAGVTLTGNLMLPFGTAIDTAANRAYVADYSNNRVAVFDLTTGGNTGSAPVINSSATASGTVGQAFQYQIGATNSPTSYALAAGSNALPAGLLLNTGSGVISGTPSSSGSTTVQLTATNASGTSAPFALTIAISTASTPPTAPVGPSITSFVFDSSTVTQTSGTFVVTFSSPVTGVDATDFVLNLQGTANATITGVTPTSSSVYRVDFTYSGNSGSLQMAIKTSGTGIQDASGNPFLGMGATAADPVPFLASPAADTTSPTVASFTAGTPSASAVNFTLTFSEPVTGVNAADFIVSKSSGMTATVGTVTGSGTTYTVPVTFTGTGGVQLTVIGGATANIRDAATNWFEGGNSATSTVATIGGGGGGTAPTISNQTVNATRNVAVNYQVVASGATSYAVVGTPALPAGLSLNTTTGVISGTPTTAGTTNVTISATNATGSANATVTIIVTSTATAPTIANQTLNAVQNTPVNYQIVATGATSFSTSGTPALPAGLSLNTTTGVVTGTPTTAGTTNVTISATNGSGSTSATLSVVVAAAGSAPTISAQSHSGTQNTPFTYQVVATGAASYSVATGSALPAGLSLNTTTGVISGTPTTAGTTNVSITATNANGSNTAVVTIMINAAGGGSGAPVVNAAIINGTVGVPLNATITATNNPTQYSLQGAPGGVSINATTGALSGTPSSAGSFSAIVTATNSKGSSSATVMFQIAQASSGGGGGGGTVFVPPPVFVPTTQSQTVSFSAPVSAVIVGQPVQLGATASSGLPVTYTIVSGDATLSGSTLIINSTTPVVVRAMQSGNTTYAAASANVTFTAQKAAQSISASGTSFSVPAEAPVKLGLTASSGLPVTYTVVSGPATISNGTLVFTGTGNVVVRASQAGNGSFGAASDVLLTYTANPVTRLTNISSRLRVTSSDSTIAGFVVTGSAPKQMLIRAVGPGLASFGISSPLSDPQLKLYDNKGALVASNAGWANDANISGAGDAVGAFKLASGSKDAALLVTLAPGSYTAQVASSNTGTVLIEVYDVSANAAVPTKQLINISTRGFVGTADDAIITGFVVAGNQPKRVLIRAVGPGLASFGVSGTLSNPVLKLTDPKGTLLAQDDNWGTAQPINSSQTVPSAADIAAAASASGAFPLQSGSNDAAILITLNPGAYTAIVTGASNATGSALVEVYEVPNP